jgi:hypothetical protein
MALPINGFVTPEQDFRGLSEVTQRVDYNKRQEQADREQKRREDEVKAGKTAASVRYFTNYLDPKDYYTGTKFDPVNNKMLGDALAQAYDLANKGASEAEISTAIMPLVGKINKYTTAGKTYSEQKKEILSRAGKIEGIDADALSDAMDRIAFPTNERGEVDVDKFNPNENYADRALREGDVYTNKAIDSFVSKAGKETMLESLKVRDSRGGIRSTKAKVTMPSFMMREESPTGEHIDFVPKYDIATDGDSAIMHNFGQQEAAVRMVTDDVFNSLPPQAKAYFVQEVRKLSKGQTPINSVQAYNLAKAIAYDELKQSGKQFSLLEEQKQELAPVYKSYNTTNVNMPGVPTEVVNNIYGRIKKAVQENQKSSGMFGVFKSRKLGVQKMNVDEQNLIVDFINKSYPDKNKATANDLEVKESSNGELEIYNANTGNILGKLPQLGTNLQVQPSVKEDRRVIQEGGQNPQPSGSISINDVPAGTKLEQKNGKYYYKGKEVKM